MSPVSSSMKVVGVAGVAAVAVGMGASQALAAGSTPSPSSTATGALAPTTGKLGPGGAGRGHGGGGGVDTAALAKALGITEAKVKAALAAVRTTMQPGQLPAQGNKPSDAERTAREKARVSVLAKHLGVSEAKLQAALDSMQKLREASRRTELSGRLDGAVKSGKINATDKTSVLKAFDAGALGGPLR